MLLYTVYSDLFLVGSVVSGAQGRQVCVMQQQCPCLCHTERVPQGAATMALHVVT